MRDRLSESLVASALALLMISLSFPARAETPPPRTSSSPTPTVEVSPPDDGDSSTASGPRVLLDPFELHGAAFYRAVGRPDLARRFEDRRALKTFGWVVGGVGLNVAALLSIFAALPSGCDGGASAPSSCGSPGRFDVTAGVVGLASLALVVIPFFFSNDPVSAEERLDLARAASFPGARF
jgi:hypothetical protein